MTTSNNRRTMMITMKRKTVNSRQERMITEHNTQSSKGNRLNRNNNNDTENRNPTLEIEQVISTIGEAI